MRLPFEPTYSANSSGGFNIRNSNGEMKGWYEKDGEGNWVAFLPDETEKGTKLGTFFSDLEACDAILLEYATPTE